MNWICKLALSIVPVNIIALAIVRLETLQRSSGESIRKHFSNNTLLIVAHPDDETMFFGPMILNLLDNNKYLDILCLSDGGSDNLGLQRKQEFKSVMEKLGPLANLKIITDDHLLDGTDQHWDVDDVAYHIDKYIRFKRDQSEAVNTIVSFDSYGVSGHDNHRSIFRALKDLKKRHQKLKLYFLNSVNIVRKYMSFFDALATSMPQLLNRSPDDGGKMTLALNLSGYKKLRQLLTLHKSQMVWFRQLYMIFSRYMFLNDFKVVS